MTLFQSYVGMSTATIRAAGTIRDMSPATAKKTAPDTAKVLVFSDRADVREQVMMAVGRRPAADVRRLTWREASTVGEVVVACEAGEVDLLVLDAEAQPTGGMGISRQLRNELEHCPPICLLLMREADRWLANWSRAEGVLTRPLDPVRAAAVIADLVRSARLPVG